MGKASRLRAKKESRRRSQIAKACARDEAPATTILDVPDDLLELVLLRVSSPVCVFRAAATCKPWRRVVAGAGFLQRFRALHGPHLLLGHYCIDTVEMEDGVRQVNTEFIPSPPLPFEHLRQHLSLDFLPRPAAFSCSHQLVLTDSRGGLLACLRDNWYAVVCDPWARQYRELDFPWVHIGERYFRNCDYHSIGAFLLDAAADGGVGGGSPISGFRLLCAWLVRNNRDGTIVAHACVYSARDCRWLRSSATTNVGYAHWTGGWSEMNPQGAYYSRYMGRAGGSILWSGRRGHVLVLDESTGEFSTFRRPAVAPGVDMNNMVYLLYQLYGSRDLRVVGGGAAGGVRIVGVVGGDLEVFTWAHGAWECTVERRVRLCQLANIKASPGLSWFLLDSAMVSVDLLICAFISASSTLKVFSLDVETMKLRLMNERTALGSQRVFPYELPWPQKISACL